MAIIEIDLEDYRDEIRYAFCKNNNCLLREMQYDASKKLKKYVEQLDYDIQVRNDKTITVEKVLRDLKYLVAELR